MNSSGVCGINFLVSFLAFNNSCKIAGIIAFSSFPSTVKGCANLHNLYPDLTFSALAFGFFLI